MRSYGWLTVLHRQHSEPSFTAHKLQPLTLLIEVIGSNQSLSGSRDLVIRLLDTLDKVVHCTGASVGQPDITYLEQLLMAVIGDLADHLVRSLYRRPASC